LLLTACSRGVVTEAYYAPEEAQIEVALSEGGDRWVVPVKSEELDSWTWSWQERFPKLVDARASAPDGEATVPRAHYAASPLDPSLPAVTVSDASADRLFNGSWRVKLRISYRSPRDGVIWTQRLRLDQDADGVWKVDLGPNPLTGLPHHATVTVQPPAGGDSGAGAS